MFSSNTSQQSEGYQIQRSLRFNSADSAYLNRTPASAGNRKTWTWSAWVKIPSVDSYSFMFGGGAGSGDRTQILLFNGNMLRVSNVQAAGSFEIYTNALFRDPSAWYHFVVAIDSTQATDSNRVKVYVNGVQQTSFASAAYPPQNHDLAVNQAVGHYVGKEVHTSNGLNAYMTEINFIDGQALTPSSFGQTNANTGVWEPKPYAGTYGTNGFYLNFSDNSNTTATTLGKDYSGNGNNWTPNNFSVTAGAGNDSLVDSPTSYGTDTGVGGTVRGNYCTLNPLDNGGITLANGNLDARRTTGSWTGLRAGFGVSQGKWYWEFTTTSNVDSVNGPMLGLMTSSASISNYPGSDANGYGYLAVSGNKFNSGSGSAYGAGWGNGDVIGIAFDADAGTLTFYKNGVSQGTAFTGLTSGPYFPALGLYGDTLASGSINFGQRPFAYTAPSGFKALCTQNLPTPTIGATASTQAGKYFNTVLWTGNSTPRSITGVGFQPDLVWARLRDTTSDYGLFDAVRGATKRVRSNTIDAEDTISGVTSFDADGFSLGTSYNGSPWLYVGWNWKANGAGVTNTAGSITSTVSANTTSGFSVVTYTGTGATATVGHGLGAVPKMIIVKVRNDTNPWNVYHVSTGATNRLLLNDTSASVTFGVWNNTTPTSSVFSLGAINQVNQASLNFVAYCFAEVQGFSKFGSYTGNGSSTDGPFVFCGFRPAYVVVKRTDGTSTDYVWWAQDNKRGPYNATAGLLALNNVDAENSSALMDFVSNGFKIRNASGSVNANGSNYIFMAFAEAPQKFALAR